MQTKTTWGITSHQSEWPLSKNEQTINAGDSVEEKKNPLTLLVGMYIDKVSMENSKEVP